MWQFAPAGLPAALCSSLQKASLQASRWTGPRNRLEAGPPCVGPPRAAAHPTPGQQPAASRLSR